MKAPTSRNNKKTSYNADSELIGGCRDAIFGIGAERFLREARL
jgi:hypothetical protein